MIIIDRFEGDYAVLETENGMTQALRCLFPEDAREGDIVFLSDGRYSVDVDATEKRRAEIAARFNRLRRCDND